VRTRFPNARIDFVVKQEFAELVRTNPHLTTVYEYESRTGLRGVCELGRQLRRQRYDLVVDLHKNFRSYLLRGLLSPVRITTYSKHLILRTLLITFGINRYRRITPVPDRYLTALTAFGVVNDGRGLELFPTAAHETNVNRIFDEAGVRDHEMVIGFGPVAAHPLKQWPLERFRDLGQELVRRYHARIALFGGARETPAGRQLAAQIPNAPLMLCGQLSLLETAAAIRKCAVFIGHDTGTAHIAAAMQRPVVALFGPTVAEFGYYPYGTRSIVISKPLPCRPCTPTGKGTCKLGTHACMTDITIAEVLTGLETLLERP